MSKTRVPLLVVTILVLSGAVAPSVHTQTRPQTMEHCVPILTQAGMSAGAQTTANGALAPLLTGLWSLHHKITTSAERAQTFFNQGLRLTYGFNHLEAVRAFQEVARSIWTAPCVSGRSLRAGAEHQ